MVSEVIILNLNLSHNTLRLEGFTMPLYRKAAHIPSKACEQPPLA
jgi:hypothetical protein